MATMAALLMCLAGNAAPVEFNRDVRPILARYCFSCHGPDRKKGGLRLDVRHEALHAIVPGQSQQSQLIRRLTARGKRRMPPPDAGDALSPEQREILRRWIDQGANWAAHWAYVPPTRPPLPSVRDHHWPRNAIDHFILAKLEETGFQPAPEADRATLLRRVTLDLTGLPPEPAEIEAFLCDRSPDAYERVVERLLASPHHGEHQARHWLDLARYADTNGFRLDNHRDLWPWRDWVIAAFNAGMPFDQFTIEQLAGDLLPGATLSQKIATGFHRNTMVNFGNGSDPREYLVKAVSDRVATTATVWLGSTLDCARCHDHKSDPFTQKDFYRFFAFFHNIAEKGLDGEKSNPVPVLEIPGAEEGKEGRP